MGRSAAGIYPFVLWLVLVLLLLLAVGTVRYVPEFQAVLSEFGTELPFLTRFILQGPIFIWILPVAALLLLASFHRQGKPRWGALFIVVVLAAAWVPTAVVGLYLPVAEVAEAVSGEDSRS